MSRISGEPRGPTAAEFQELLRRQGDGEAHDRGLIVERLGWTPEERLRAHTAFLRFYLQARPSGPRIDGS